MTAARTPRARNGAKGGGFADGKISGTASEVAMASAAAAAALAAGGTKPAGTSEGEGHLPSFGYKEDGDGGLDIVPAVSWGTNHPLSHVFGRRRNGSPVRLSADDGHRDLENTAAVGGTGLLTSDEEGREVAEAASVLPAASNDEERTLRTNASRGTYGTRNTALSLFTILPRVDPETLLYLSAFAILGETVRVFAGRLFGVDCELYGTGSASFVDDWFGVGARHVCVTSTGTSERMGGAAFADLPANILGCFVMGIMTLSSDWPVVPWLRGDHPLQSNDAIHLAIRTGLCGSLTTFASWNTQMVAMMDGTGLPSGSRVLSALFGYLIGLQCAVASFLFGRHVGVYLNRWRNPHLAETDAAAGPHATAIRRSRRRSVNSAILRHRRRMRRGQSTSLAVTERHANTRTGEANGRVSEDEVVRKKGLRDALDGAVEHLRRKNDRRKRGGEREAARFSLALAASKSPSSSVSGGGKPRSRSDSKGSSGGGHSSTRSKSTAQRGNRRVDGQQQQSQRSSAPGRKKDHPTTRRHRRREHAPSSSSGDGRRRRGNHAQDHFPPNIIVLPSAGEVLSATDALRRLPFRLCNHRAAPFLLVLSILALYAYGDAVTGTPFYRTMWLSALFTPPGAVLRWKLSVWNGRLRGESRRWIPAGTLAANVLGCLVSAGCAAASIGLSRRDDAESWRWTIHCLDAARVGFAGSLSTVSTYVKEVVDITERYSGRNARGYKYAFGTMTLCCLLGLLVYIPVVRM
uniref:Fluoride ion transporter CrcB n=1 Tax=Odontella aurita TaxID=265563 RepID=A0A7S4J026_9STRA